jgi:DNA repair exonuclease SbcCD ATPase subunit
VKFHTLTLENFLGFRRTQQVPIADRGLVWIRGDNRVSSAADQNGVGKTSLAHALAYAYFGQTLDGRRADDVACRFTDGPCVVSVASDDFEIVRGRRPKRFEILSKHDDKLIGNDDKERQAWIEDQLGYGYRTFRNAVVFGQGNFDRFASAEQNDQLRMLDEIQGVDFREALKRSKAWRDRVAEAAALAQIRIDAHQRSIEEFERQETALLERRNNFETNLDEQRQRVEDRLRLAMAQAKNQDEVLREMTKRRKELPDLRARVAAVVALEETMKLAAVELRISEDAHAAAILQRDKVIATIAKLEKAGRCPTCRAETSVAVGPRFAQDWREADEAVKKRIDVSIRHRKAYADAATTLREAQIGAPDKNELARLENAAGDMAFEQAKRVLATMEEQIVHLKAEQRAVLTRTWDDAALLSTVQERLTEVRKEQARFVNEHANAAVSVRAAEYWVEAFGDYGIRSLLFDSVAGYLMDRVTQHLSALAAGEVTVPISAQTRNKSGTLKERMSIAPSWLWGGDGSGTGSHGQDRRVDLAIFAALQDLAESRSARPFTLRVWDEPGDALDMRGIELFVRWIESRARTTGMGWLITHNPAIAELIRPDEVWNVVFDQDGGRVEFA